MDRLTFGMRVLNITQSGTMLDGKPNLSHPNMALDLAGSDSGKDFWFAKSRMKCIGEMWLHNLNGARVRGYGTYAFTFVDDQGNPAPMRMADGTDKIVTLAMTHSSQQYIKSIPGKIYEVDQPVYEEGGKGAKGDQAFGNHIHLEIAEGVTINKYYDKNLGVYRMNHEINPVDCFFILEGFTTVKSTHGLTFKCCDSVKVEIMENSTKLVEYAKTQIGNTGKKYMDWAGYSDPWCSEFVSYCADKCGFIKDGLMPKAGNCQQAHDFYKPKGELHKKADYAPKSGDIVYFGKTGTDHTAIVESASDTTITVIEGNAGNPDYMKSKVCRTVYHKTDPWLWGYANPLNEEDEKVYLKAARMGFNIRTGTVDGKVITVVPKGKRAEILQFSKEFKSDGFQWVKVRYGSVTGYSQLDTKYYLIEN